MRGAARFSMVRQLVVNTRRGLDVAEKVKFLSCVRIAYGSDPVPDY